MFLILVLHTGHKYYAAIIPKTDLNIQVAISPNIYINKSKLYVLISPFHELIICLKLHAEISPN